MEADFTLVPFGGLGNRMYAICSAIAYCQKNKKSLKKFRYPKISSARIITQD